LIWSKIGINLLDKVIFLHIIYVMSTNILIGDRFGKLVVKEAAEPKNGYKRWKCICDCGNTTISHGTGLRSEHSKSCGCLRSINKPKENLIGKSFGRLLVIDKIMEGNKTHWLCLCDCDELTVADCGAILKSGHKTSCGCYHSEISSKTVIERNKTHRYAKYEPMESVARIIYATKYSDGTLQYEEFFDLSQKDCRYCGIKPSNIRNVATNNRSQYFNDNCIFIYNGLDRVDNDLPHNTNNCVTACDECNSSKNKYTLSFFLNMVENIHIHRNDTIPNYYSIFLQSNGSSKDFQSAYPYLHFRYKDIDFTQDLLYFILTQNCFFCGNTGANKTKSINGTIIPHNGLDRLNQSLPHTLNNIVACCKYCNWSKAARSCQQFRDWAARVYNHTIAPKLSLQY
jgi:hypothetical protein